MNELENAPVFIPGGDPTRRDEIKKTGRGWQGFLAGWWRLVGLTVLICGVLGILWDIFHPIWVDWLAGAVEFFYRVPNVPTYTPYIIFLFGVFCIWWGIAFGLRKDWAWLVGLWVNGFAALLCIIGALYLAQVSWSGFSVGSVHVSRLWLSFLLVVAAALFVWACVGLNGAIREAYYLVHTQKRDIEKVNIELAQMLFVCNYCGRRLQADGRCPIHNPMVGLLEEGGSPRLFKIDKEMVTVGRGAGCDIVLDPLNSPKFKSISALHAIIRIDDNANWFIQDQKSSNHTRVNDQILPLPGKTLEDFVRLEFNTKISFGEADFSFHEYANGPQGPIITK